MESRGISKNVIPTKIYGSEKVLFDVTSEAPSFLSMNGYGSENEAFFFCLVSWYSRKWFTTAWKSYEAGPFRCYAALAGSAGPSLASGRKIYSSEQRSYIRQTTNMLSKPVERCRKTSYSLNLSLVLSALNALYKLLEKFCCILALKNTYRRYTSLSRARTGRACVGPRRARRRGSRRPPTRRVVIRSIGGLSSSRSASSGAV